MTAAGSAAAAAGWRSARSAASCAAGGSSVPYSPKTAAAAASAAAGGGGSYARSAAATTKAATRSAAKARTVGTRSGTSSTSAPTAASWSVGGAAASWSNTPTSHLNEDTFAKESARHAATIAATISPRYESSAVARRAISCATTSVRLARVTIPPNSVSACERTLPSSSSRQRSTASRQPSSTSAASAAWSAASATRPRNLRLASSAATNSLSLRAASASSSASSCITDATVRRHSYWSDLAPVVSMSRASGAESLRPRRGSWGTSARISLTTLISVQFDVAPDASTR